MSETLYCFEIELIEDLENLLDDFFQDMISDGLKLPTAERHAANADLFLIQYHAIYYLEDASSLRAEKLYDFLGLWYFQKVTNPNSMEIQSILTSLKRLFDYLFQKGILREKDWKELKKACLDKEYFMNRYHEFEAKEAAAQRKESLEDWEDWIAEVADRYVLDEDQERYLDSLINRMSLYEILEILKNLYCAKNRTDNVIRLENVLKKKKEAAHSPRRPKKKRTPTAESLLDHAMAIHRANLVFIRWLDRFNCSPTDLPPEPCSTCVLCDSLLSNLIAKLENAEIDQNEFECGHDMIDFIDRILWDARHDIAANMGLDLRLLAI
ncbi:MAG: hypothetical protein AB1656_18570 [Candidatus Omnitrophota bacterium]